MTSIVTDLLNSAGVLVKEDIPSKVGSFRRKIEGIKLEIQEILKNRYIDFISHCVKLDKLTETLNLAKSEYEVLHYHIEKEIKPQLNTSVTEYHEMYEDLKKIEVLKHAVSDLISMHKHLETLKSSLAQKSYSHAADSVLKFQKEYDDINCDSQKDVEIFCALKTEFYVAKESFIHYLHESWKQIVRITQTEGNRNYVSQTDISIQIEPVDEFSDIIVALDNLGQLDYVLKSFGKTFLNLVCHPIIFKDTEIMQKHLNEKATITVSVLRNEPQDPNIVFKHLTQFFQYLNIFPFKFSLGETANDDTLMMRFGKLLNKDFCSLLVEECLLPAVPSQSCKSESFKNSIHNAVNLHNFMIELGFFPNDENLLMQFIQTVDDFHANKMTLDMLGRARELMKQDLHQTVVVGLEESFFSTTIQDQVGELTNVACGKSSLSKASFAFPSCHISISTRELAKLLHEVIQEAKSLEAQSQSYSLKLFYTARSICELYCCVVPTYHKDEIKNIPQQTAVHHNNCMYIAHCLLTLGIAKHTFNTSLPVTFVDLVPELRRIGTDAFLAQMRTQRQHILQLLKDPEAFPNIGQDDNLLNKAEKTVRQCLQQLEFLKRVWSNVLPVEVYFKAIGTLLNTFLEEVILHVISMEDIAAHAAAQLDSVFAIVLKQSQELFKVEHGDKRSLVHKYVKKWFKFQELQLVLGATLKEIVDRWSCGKGPLASDFSSDEVKHLIRALFQNTERRAAALGKIR